MSDLLFDLWLASFLRGGDSAERRQLCRAMLLCGQGTRLFDLEGPFRVGFRRWDIG